MTRTLVALMSALIILAALLYRARRCADLAEDCWDRVMLRREMHKYRDTPSTAFATLDSVFTSSTDVYTDRLAAELGMTERCR